LSKCAAEAIGTVVIVFAGCGAIMASERFPGSVPGVIVPIVFGLAVVAMVYAVGHISGAHFNPAVTLAFAFGDRFPKARAGWYCLAQCIGAIAASALTHALFPPGHTYGATVAHVDVMRALGWEVMLTFILMFVIMGVATDAHAIGTMAGAAVGATVMLLALVGGPASGASMNPARSLGPALFEGRIGELWIYIVGPIIGAQLAAITYNVIRCKDTRPPSTD
jgi:MIP family channel proteins